MPPSGPAWFCCCGCDSGADNFNRDDSTDLGTKWYEWPLDAHGDWRISGDALAEFSESGNPSYVRWEQHGSKWMIDYVYVWWPQAGDTYSLYLDWDGEEIDSVAGTGNCARVDYTFAAATLTIAIYSVTGGVATLIDSCVEAWAEAPEEGAAWYQISACITPTTIMAPISGGGSVRVDNPGFDGTYAGLGHDCGRIVAFDNWWWSEEYSADVRCPKCGFCSCDALGEKKVANVLDLTYVGYDEGCNNCMNLDGFTVKLRTETCAQTGWESDFSVDPGHPFGDYGVSRTRWGLPCPLHGSDDLANWILSVRKVYTIPPGTVATSPICGHTFAQSNYEGVDTVDMVPNVEESSCDPFVLVYDIDVHKCEADPHTSCGEPPSSPETCPNTESPPVPPWYDAVTDCSDEGECGRSISNSALRPLWHRIHFKIIITEATTT